VKPVVTLALLLFSALWGASYLFVRVASPVVGPVVLVEARLVLAAVGLVAYGALRRQQAVTLQDWRSYVVLGGVNGAVPLALIAAAELLLPASLTAIVSATTPMFTAPMAVLVLRDSLGVWRFLGLVVGFTGVVMTVGLSSLPLSGAVLLCVAAVLLSSVFYAYGGVYCKATFPHTSALMLATMQQLTAALLLSPVTAVVVVTQRHTGALSSSVVLAIVALAIPCTSVAYLLYFFVLNRAGPTRTSTASFLVPVFSVVCGAVFLHESVGFGMVAGAIVVALGLALVLSRVGDLGGHPPRSEPEPVPRREPGSAVRQLRSLHGQSRTGGPD